MAVPSALHLALDLARSPLLTRIVRQQPVPDDVLTLLRIAARDPEATRQAAKLTGKDPAVVRAAAVLYLQQILWTPDANHYRALGVRPDAPQAVMLQHLRLLMKWLHPDQQRLPQEEAFAERVVNAWNAVKTPERRKLYDQSLGTASTRSSKTKKRRSARRLPWVFGSMEKSPAGAHLTAWRIAAVVVAATALVAVLAIDWTPLAVSRPSQDAKAAQTTTDIHAVPIPGQNQAADVDLTEVGGAPAPQPN